LSEGELAVTASSLREHFVGDYPKIAPVAREVLQKLQEEHPELIVQRKNGPMTNTVVRDRDLFIKKMQERGFQQKDESIEEIKQTDIAITASSLKEYFIGRDQKLLSIANEVLREMDEESPEFVTQRKKGTHIVTVVTNSDLFIEEMQKRGIQKKERIMGELQETDFAITARAMSAHFLGDYRKLLSLSRDVLQELQQEHPEIVFQRKSGTRIVTVISNPELFIQKMVEEGAKMREEKKE
jgi:hypothetical protein